MQNFIVLIAIITLIVVQTDSSSNCYICEDDDCTNAELKTCRSDYSTPVTSTTDTMYLSTTTAPSTPGQHNSSSAPPPPTPAHLGETFYCLSVVYNDTSTGEPHIKKDCTTNSEVCEEYFTSYGEENVQTCETTEASSDSADSALSISVYISTKVSILMVVLNKFLI